MRRAIWEEYRAGIKAFLYSRVTNPSDVDDLLQDVLIKTFRNFHTVKSNDSIKSWIFQISNNAVIDYYRKKGKLKQESIPEDLHYDEENPSVHKALSKCVEPFIKALPKDSKELLTAIDIERIPQREYAQELGINYSTLKSRVHKSRLQLRKLYGECCELSLDRQGNIADFNAKSGKCEKC